MVPAIIIGMMMTFNQFNVIYFVSGGGPLHPTEILVTQAYRLVNETTVNLPGIGNVRPYGMAASFAYIVFIILATITLVTNRISRATESYRTEAAWEIDHDRQNDAATPDHLADPGDPACCSS